MADKYIDSLLLSYCTYLSSGSVADVLEASFSLMLGFEVNFGMRLNDFLIDTLFTQELCA